MKTLMVLALAVVLLFQARLQASPSKSKLEVVVLGSGGPRAFGRAGSSYIVAIEGTPRASWWMPDRERSFGLESWT